MPHMLLIHEPVGQREQRGPEKGREVYAEMQRFAEGLQDRGLLLATESLSSQAGGARVQVRDGQRRVVDGPFAEVKEMIGGFFLLSCDDRSQAVAIAAACPAAQWATVEVRAVGPCYT